LLADNEIDLGLVPAVTYLDRSTDLVVPGIAIASDGPVASVALFTKKPIADVRVIALDTSSRTSVVLTRILCAKRFGIDAEFINRPPDLPSMLAEADAALIIGDLALFAQHESVGAEKIDLGQEWTAWTSLPFVWAFWAGRADAADRRVVGRLQEARDAGVLASDAIADAYCAGDPARQRAARQYLRQNIKYDLSDREQAGLARYFREAAALGLGRPIDRVRYF
jgi:chorismate dehydratase